MHNLITVIISAYNGDRYLSAAIDSVLAQVNVDFEIIIVDDGSTDGTAEIIKKYASPKLTSIWQCNQGQGAAFNHALKLARGKFVTFLDQDDIFFPNKLFLQLEVLQKNPEIDMVFGHVEQFISPELSEEIKLQRECPKNPIAGFLPSVGMFRKECFVKVGPFNTHWQVGSCIDWCIRAKEKNLKDYTLDEIVTRRRIHDKNQSIIARSHYKNYFQIIKEKLERSRQVKID